MILKWLNFNRKICIVFVLSISPFIVSTAQNGYDVRVEKYNSTWQKLIPRYMKMQYAGGMGFLSLGTGWDYGKNKQWETDVFMGYLPKFSTDNSKITFTLRQNFMPWNTKLNDKFSFEPLATGLYVNTILGDDFWVHEPDRYPKGYYGFSTKMRFNIYAGQRITYNIPHDKRSIAKSFTFYYEISSNDLYLVNAFTDSYWGPKNYLRLSFGIKMQIL
ncbi:hypothetical protein [Dysgonomonas sp. ZJ279]|uniref:hypothetical protein n=1 Tax=Dysgonomonas sp. ZJ279 TaxID=2709796 RepID=UPI0013EBAF89|nr:hypothetical protein [Dysgonomonas sp. ZJ279]